MRALHGLSSGQQQRSCRYLPCQRRLLPWQIHSRGATDALIGSKHVPQEIVRPPYAAGGVQGWVAGVLGSLRTDFGKRIAVQQTTEEIAALRHACQLAREVLDCAGRAVRPGLTTAELDEVVHEATIQRRAYPSPLGYRGFPASCCTSVNDVVAHGVPGPYALRGGDVISVDVTVFTSDGFHGDCCETFYVPGGSAEHLARCAHLARATHDALMTAIAACRPGLPYAAIGRIIEDALTPCGLNSVRDLCGHGIGRDFHMRPRVWHYRHDEWPFLGEGNMCAGHSFTIEPMVVEGGYELVELEDEWTMVTADGSWCAQFEHTLLMTELGVEALTARTPSSPPLFWDVV